VFWSQSNQEELGKGATLLRYLQIQIQRVDVDEIKVFLYAINRGLSESARKTTTSEGQERERETTRNREAYYRVIDPLYSTEEQGCLIRELYSVSLPLSYGNDSNL